MKKYLLIIISAFLSGIAQQPIYLGLIAWFSFIPIFYHLENKFRYKDFFYSGFIWGFIYHLTTIFWLSMNIGTNHYIASLTMILAVLVLSINSIIIFSVLYLFKKYYSKQYLYFLPFIWILVEYIKSFGTLGFPWVSIANTQIDYLVLIQNAEFLGIYGISFWIILINVILYQNLKNRVSYRYYLIIFFIPWIIGLFLYNRLNTDLDSNLNIALIQPNISLEEKWIGSPNKNFNKILDLSKTIQKQTNDILVWPESALPSYFLQSNTNQINRIHHVLGDSTKLITGTTIFEKGSIKNKVFNSIAYIDNNRIIDYYNKIQLVPMAEYVPWSNFFTFLDDLNLGQANFSIGKENKIFDYNETKFGSVVCYESTFPWLINEFIKQGAEFIIIVTNDGWYETAPEPQQHAKQSIYRAIENRKPIIRCANTGISMIIDQAGNIKQRLELNKTGTIRASIIPNKKITFYIKYGDYLIKSIAVLLLIFLLISIYKKDE